MERYLGDKTDKTGWDCTKEPKWMRQCAGIFLVSSMKGRMIQCSRCKKKWFDFWYKVEWPDSTSEEMCLDCFEKKVEGRKEEDECQKKPKKKSRKTA